MRKPTVFSEADLLTLSDLNLAESHREHARFLAPTEILERESCLFTASGTRYPVSPFNAVMALGPRPADAGRLLDEARSFFSAHSRGYGIVVREHLDRALEGECEARGLPRTGDTPGMVLAERLATTSLPKGLSLRPVRTPEAANDFAAVSASAYETLELPAGVTRKFLSQPAAWLAPHWHVEVLYDGDLPSAAAMILLSHGIAGVYWVGTIPAARGRGFAAEVTRSVSNAAFDRGARAVVLQASRFGEPIYRRLGFRTITRYVSYLDLSTKT